MSGSSYYPRSRVNCLKPAFLSIVRVTSSEPVHGGDVAGAHRPAGRQEPGARSVSARHRELLPAAQDTVQLHRVPQLHRPLWAEGCAAGLWLFVQFL